MRFGSQLVVNDNVVLIYGERYDGPMTAIRHLVVSLVLYPHWIRTTEPGSGESLSPGMTTADDYYPGSVLSAKGANTYSQLSLFS